MSDETSERTKEFYEDAHDVLNGFRREYMNQKPIELKDGEYECPFGKDPDSMQYDKQMKLFEQQIANGFGYRG